MELFIGRSVIKIGIYHDLMISVTKFCDEKKGSTTLASDVANAPITMDAARRVFFFFRWLHPIIMWQLAKRKRQQVPTLFSILHSVNE